MEALVVFLTISVRFLKPQVFFGNLRNDSLVQSLILDQEFPERMLSGLFCYKVEIPMTKAVDWEM
jgi:hypothetical protein